MRRFFSLLLSLLFVISFVFPVFALTTTPTADKSVLSALYEADISTLREAIDKRIISCEDLTLYYLERINSYNKNYNCFITVCEDAVDVARERDAALARGENSGSLFGIPVVIKDNMNLTGYYTTNGHHLEDSELAESDAKAVSLLIEQGAVIIGKTNMSTDAQDARTSFSKIAGETKNAYNTLLSAGGSSGGTAAAVSLNFAAAGLGTDTNSSLRIPAILNGCVSLRTTLKKISFDGCTHLNNSRDVVGAVTKTVQDQAIMLDVLTENKYSFENNLDKDAVSGLRLGILSELTYPVETTLITEGDEELKEKKIKQFDLQYRIPKNFDSEISSVFRTAVTNLRNCGAEVTEVSMPELFEAAYLTFEKHEFSIKAEFYNKIKAFMKANNLDALIFPTYTSSPLKTGTDSTGKKWNVWSQVFLNNCRVISPSASMPEMSMLIGYHSSGAGIGMEILADKNCEQLLLNIAYTYSERYGCRIAPTGAPDIYISHRTESLGEIANKYDIPVISDNINTENPTESTSEYTEPSSKEIGTDTAVTKPPTENNLFPVIAATVTILSTAIVICIIFAVKRKR